MIQELFGQTLRSADEAASWAHRSLPAKNTLTAPDAELVEAGFRLKLAAVGEGERTAGQPAAVERLAGTPVDTPATQAGATSVTATQESGADGIPPAGKTIRLRDKDHLKFVSKQACVVCGREPSDAHHLRFAQPRALGRKVSDEFTVPVCRLHHRELHRHGDEAAWWNGVNVDPLTIALTLWQSTHRDGAFSPPCEAVENFRRARNFP